MGKRRPDRRIERTKRQLHAALLALIERRSYPRITVHDITAHANVGRSTFYSHFNTPNSTVADRPWGPCPVPQGDGGYKPPCTSLGGPNRGRGSHFCFRISDLA